MLSESTTSFRAHRAAGEGLVKLRRHCHNASVGRTAIRSIVDTCESIQFVCVFWMLPNRIAQLLRFSEPGHWIAEQSAGAAISLGLGSCEQLQACGTHVQKEQSVIASVQCGIISGLAQVRPLGLCLRREDVCNCVLYLTFRTSKDRFLRDITRCA